MHTIPTLRQLIGIFALAAITLATAGVLSAWTGPSQSPPNGNVSAPVNVGSVDQVKNAALGVNSLAVFGNQYVQDRVGIGVENPSAALDIAGNIRLRGGSPGQGKILVSVDNDGNLEWATVSYQEAQSSGVIRTYNLSPSQTPGSPLYALVDDMETNGNVTPNSIGTPYDNAATRERMCEVMAGSNASVLTHTNGDYYSPRDNYVYKWDGNIWKRYGANGHNSFVENITCRTPGVLQFTTDSGRVF